MKISKWVKSIFHSNPMGRITHVTVLTPERIRQIGMATGFEVLKYGNSYRSLVVGKRSKFVRVILYKIRTLFEFVFGFLYFGGPVPLDPNMTLSLRLRRKKEKFQI